MTKSPVHSAAIPGNSRVGFLSKASITDENNKVNSEKIVPLKSLHWIFSLACKLFTQFQTLCVVKKKKSRESHFHFHLYIMPCACKLYDVHKYRRYTTHIILFFCLLLT